MQKSPIQAILFDLDGIVIKKRPRFFSEQLAHERGVPVEDVTVFFTGPFKACSFGKADLKEIIAPYLPAWNYTGSATSFLNNGFHPKVRKTKTFSIA